ncbi:hypothetical protein PPSIR1_30831 [Plesiocystis pacifica SIR-1]|uniref:YtkA-like domain-containing protein n=1 Tax=Plesiocystis pacifica SIR-1 TaxID=391625 RepID=A6GAH9_9BACT|nr:FixH family protein [Plesiocystis pacifica]EDM77167.1 hypothetical protein PPSIR1_30831 [Plesiocystis pacifica SIR-1]
MRFTSLRLFELAIPLAIAALVPLSACDGDSGDDEAADDHADHSDHADHGETEAEGCESEDRDDEFAVGLSKSGDVVSATFVSSDPAPPHKGDNTWVLDFTDLGGQPMAGLTMTAVPMMPDHGHGTPVNAVVTETETPGRYEVTPVNLFMTGLWEVTFEITTDGGTDSLMFAFCVE